LGEENTTDQEGDSGSASDPDDGQTESDGGSGAAGGFGPANPSLTDRELTERLAELTGTLAVGNGSELSVVRPDGAGSLLLDGSESVLASQPTWSRDGTRLAWGSISADRQVVLVQDFDDDGLPDGDPSISNVAGNPVFYLQWNGDDERLVYIRNAESGGVVEIGTLEPGAPAVPVGEGAPFFVSWGPETDRIVGHVNERSIDLYELDDPDGPEAGFSTVLPNGGGFSAPAWVDDSRVLVVIAEEFRYLDVTSGQMESIVEVPGQIRFVLSPDRTAVAYQTMGGAGGPSLASLGVQQDTTDSSLIVLDLETGEQTLVTNQLAVAWEWSPDSDKLAWLEAEVTAGRPAGTWSFWSRTGPLATPSTPVFNLSGKYGRNYLPFFAQYAQSVTGWSPDSSAYAFAGAMRGDGGVWIQLVTEAVAPRIVSAGDFVTWGSSDVPLPPTGGPSAA
jgi:TolB protein